MKSGIAAFVAEAQYRDVKRLDGPLPLPTAADTAAAPYLSYPVYALSLSDAASAAGLSAAVPAGWRFFAGREPGKILLGRVSNFNSAGLWKMTGAHYGPRVYDAYKAVQALEQLRQVAERDYEPRILNVPALNIEVWWLFWKGNGEDQSLIVPFPLTARQASAAPPPEGAHTAAEFAAMIRPKALLLKAMSTGGSGS
jgi:hypothetical protein